MPADAEQYPGWSKGTDVAPSVPMVLANET